ncbi:HNH endonuclease signature motif containing protein [Methanobrevibacter arboriphilus]|uniref:Uncharacterized protein n=1 Tax=Methanobrevibacter arboriphilus TaxID=39441 RepID=A0ACA8R5Q6_METAZ|nr:HNH endonuclease signature motif containing protein [Methanobrevibacter arboriphilus]BBL62384.1 hypothetical protein MarbSA_14240 [Methanobrevibacter arboriphilus]
MSIKTKYGDAMVSQGYYYIFSEKEGNKGKFLHRLVWEDRSQIKIPKGYIIHHLDENKLNNDIENLICIQDKIHRQYHKYGTTHDKQTKIKMSESHKGEKNPNVIISEKQVLEIKNLKKQGVHRKKVFKRIAKPLGMSFKGFEHIWYNKTWKHVQI